MACSCYSILGGAVAIFGVYKILASLWNILYPHVLAKSLGHVINVKTLGKWAVVTGATDGIGKGYAKELAKRGVNVYLISRSEEKLQATADEISKASPNVEIKTLAIDFQRASPEDYRTTIADELMKIEIGILVNNVGMSYTFPEELTKVENGEEFLQNILLVNCASAMQMTRLVLPQMLERKKGAIIAISSAASFGPMPLLSVYSATKILLDYFSRGVAMEYADSGIFFQVVHPFYVVTKMSGLSRSSFWAPDPDRYAVNALDTVGILDSTSGCLSHDIQRFGMKLVLKVLPERMFAAKVKQDLEKMKQRYFRNLEKGNKGE